MNGRKIRESGPLDVADIAGLAVFVGVFLVLLRFCVLSEAFAAPPPEPARAGSSEHHANQGR